MKLKKENNKIIAIILVAIAEWSYNFFAIGEGMWRDYYFINVNLSRFILMFLLSFTIKNITSKGIALFISLLFLVSAIFDNYVYCYYYSIIVTILIIVYGVVFRTIFIKPFVSDYYNEKYNYIVVRKPKRTLELLRAYFFLDSIGSVKVVNKGIEQGFKVKKHNTESIQKKHTYNPDYFVYLRTDKDIFMKNNKYNILTNNCTSCWNINILKEIKHGR